MLLDKSTKVYEDLSTYPDLTSLLSKGVNGIRPLLAEDDDGDQFVTYSLRYVRSLTKGSVSEFQVVVQCWAKTYNESVAIADKVEAAFKASFNYYQYVSAQAAYNDQSEIYTEQIFNLKN